MIPEGQVVLKKYTLTMIHYTLKGLKISMIIRY